MPVLTLAELQSHLGGTLRGNAEVRLEGVASLEHAQSNQLGFLLSPKFLKQAHVSLAGALIVPAKLDPTLADSLPQPCLALDNPHAGFARAVSLLQPEPLLALGIHPSAVVAEDAEIGPDVRIGPGVVIGPRAKIGARCQIGPLSVIGPEAELGESCLLHARVVVQHDCILGNRVILHSGAVIGADGYGLAWVGGQDGGAWLKVPQAGRVILEDDVEVGANTCIDRGALDDTVIEAGAKLDNLIQIAHNCRVGRHTAIAACVGIAGSTRIGAYCQIGGAAMIIGHLDICDRVTVSAGTFVAKDIREPGVYTSVQPLMKHEDWKHNAAHLRHLDALVRRVKSLEEKLKDN